MLSKFVVRRCVLVGHDAAANRDAGGVIVAFALIYAVFWAT